MTFLKGAHHRSELEPAIVQEAVLYPGSPTVQRVAQGGPCCQEKPTDEFFCRSKQTRSFGAES